MKKKVAVVGLGTSNLALIRYLLKSERPEIAGFDRKAPTDLAPGVRDFLSRNGIRAYLGEDCLENLTGFDEIYLTPGMPKDFPQIQAELKAGAKVTSEINLFLERCRATTIGITGSSGKTTTTTLTWRIIRESGTDVLVGGNIGQPLIELVDEIAPDTVVVLELSSFQLHLAKTSPNLSAVLNVTPNHLDIHSSMEEYIWAKQNAVRYQSGGDVAVLNYDDPITRDMADLAKGQVAFFSHSGPVEPGAWVEQGAIWLNLGDGKTLVSKTDIVKIPGDHNLYNIMAACVLTGLLNVTTECMARVISSFTGVEHRLETIDVISGVKFINDSIATTPERAIAALEAIKGPVILIAGGYDKHLPFDGFARRVIERGVKLLITLGQMAQKIEEAVSEHAGAGEEFPRIIRCKTFEEGFNTAWSEAESGDTVLLSPACASYDMFKNYEERGRVFKEMVRQLAGRTQDSHRENPGNR